MKISWMSNAPWARTGYGNQTLLFAPRLQKLGHEVAVTAFYGLEGGVLNWNGIKVYPRGYDGFGLDVMSAHAAHFHADILITLMDAWVVNPALIMAGTRWVPWFPVDHDPLPPPVKNAVTAAYARIVYSRHAEERVKKAGLDCYYVPHGVDTKAFAPVERLEVRKALGIDPALYVVGIVAANKGVPARKSWAQNLGAFGEFKRNGHPEALLYCHTVLGMHGENQGMNLAEFCDLNGLKWGLVGSSDPAELDVLFCDQYQGMLGYDEAYMNAIYNAFDVTLAVSMGEGFGIPIVESQAAGCPVITGEWTSMPELTFSGWKVPLKEAEPFWTPLGAWQYIPHTGAIREALESAYRMRGNEDYRKRARKGALAYDADKVTEKYWQPTLEAIGERLGETEKVQLVKF